MPITTNFVGFIACWKVFEAPLTVLIQIRLLFHVPVGAVWSDSTMFDSILKLVNNVSKDMHAEDN